MKQKLHTFAQISATICNPHFYTYTLKTRKKRTTDFVFHFSRVMSGQKCKYRLGKKCARDFTSPRQPISLHDFFFYVGEFF